MRPLSFLLAVGCSTGAFAQPEVPPTDLGVVPVIEPLSPPHEPMAVDVPISVTAPVEAPIARTAETPPPPPARRVTRAPTSGPQLEGPRDGVPDCRAGAAICLKNDLFALWPRLRLRAGYEGVQADSERLTVGHNDGFFIDQARLGVDGAFQDDFRFRLIVDVVTPVPGGQLNDPVQPIVAAARDAWLAWMPSDWFYASVGQQFMPADLEGTTTLAALPFTRRSVATAGIRAGTGIAVSGLSPARQLSVVVGSTDGARIGALALQYMLGVGNGNGQNVLGNDNKLPAAYARLGAGYVPGDDVFQARIGVGGRYNPRTVGVLPSVFAETDTVLFVDAEIKAVGFTLAGQGIFKQITFDDVVPDFGTAENGVGATAWLVVEKPFGVSLAGVKPAYRFSYFDPSSSIGSDAVIENTVGVRWDVPVEGLPVSLLVDATLLTETGDGVRDLDNARVAALLQLEL